jgi:hypothetical protein
MHHKSLSGLAEDAKAVWAWVQQRTQPPPSQQQEQGANTPSAPVSVYLYGQSLGSAVALGLAHHLATTQQQGGGDGAGEGEGEGQCDDAGAALASTEPDADVWASEARGGVGLAGG